MVSLKLKRQLLAQKQLKLKARQFSDDKASAERSYPALIYNEQQQQEESHEKEEETHIDEQMSKQELWNFMSENNNILNENQNLEHLLDQHNDTERTTIIRSTAPTTTTTAAITTNKMLSTRVAIQPLLSDKFPPKQLTNSNYNNNSSSLQSKYWLSSSDNVPSTTPLSAHLLLTDISESAISKHFMVSASSSITGSNILHNETTAAAAAAYWNLNMQDVDYFYRHSSWMSALLIFAYIVVFVVGLVGNSFVIAVVLRAPRMRTVTNYFIVNLALADILVIVFCLPATLMSNIVLIKTLSP